MNIINLEGGGGSAEPPEPPSGYSPVIVQSLIFILLLHCLDTYSPTMKYVITA